jgi:hypothetical protein
VGEQVQVEPSREVHSLAKVAVRAAARCEAIDTLGSANLDRLAVGKERSFVFRMPAQHGSGL